MKTKLALIIALGLGLVSAPAFAYDRDEHHGDRDEHHDNDRDHDWNRHRGELERHINRVNKMLAHVKWELSRYGGDWKIQRDVDRISDDVRKVNWRFEHHKFGDRGDLRDDVRELRGKLHNVEERLHVRSRDFFRWD